MDKHIEQLITEGKKSTLRATETAVAPAEHRAAADNELRAATSAMLQRLQFMRQAGITFKGQRDLYDILGYDRLITTRQYRDRYARGGLAGRIVDVYPNATWRGEVEVVEDDDSDTDTTFEAAWKTLCKKHKLVEKMLRADKLAGISTYSVLLLGAQGDLGSELPKGKPERLLYATPFLGGGGPGGDANNRAVAVDSDCTIQQYDVDPASPRFGLPLSYQLKRTDIVSPLLARPVHWTRIVHIAENCLFDEVFGQPALERVWNLLDDLDKVTGGGSEAFWLRANQGLHLNIDKDMTMKDPQAALDSLKQQAEDYSHQLTRWLKTRGVDVKTLGSDVANFSSPADSVLTQIAGAKGIPKRILTGSEMGELASSQDRDNWKDQVNGRQTQYAGPFIVRPLVDRLIAYGYLPTPTKGVDGYEVVWPHIEVLTEDEKAKGANTWAMTNKTQGEVIFTNDEIRHKWYGMEPLDPKDKLPVGAPVRVTAGPGNDPADPTADPAALAGLEASEEELVEILKTAIECGNHDVINHILMGPAE